MKSNNFRAFLFLFLLILIPVLLSRYLSSHRDPPMEMDLSTLSLSGHTRMLVLAPHCDDETLGAGGIIQAAIRQNIQVQVVIATNGDGYLFATMQEFHRIYPRSQDFIRMGNLRQQESLSALKILGVPAADVVFLSYPDRGLPALWNQHWLATAPYRSQYSAASRSPYAITYNPQAVYAGEDLLADLKTILTNFRPDLVIYPHPDDVHPDHWGLSVFTRLALAERTHQDPSFHPDAFAYLIHRPDFPSPTGLHPNASLTPPNPVAQIFPHWSEFPLAAEDIPVKQVAVSAYTSQLPSLRTLLESFVRRNELFGQVSPAILPHLAAGTSLTPSTWRDEALLPIPPVQSDPVKDTFFRSSLSSADLRAVYAVELADHSLLTCAETRGGASQVYNYRIRLTAVADTGVLQYAASSRPTAGQGTLLRSGQDECFTIPLAQLGNPWLIAIDSSTEEIGTGILDQTAWQLILVQPNQTLPFFGAPDTAPPVSAP
jgi:LmbE family N-acetylglucosaminyl deacetylase